MLLDRRDVNIMLLISLMKFLRIQISYQRFSKNLTISWFLQTHWLFIFLQEVASLSFPVKNTNGPFPDYGNSPSSKLQKCNLVYLLNTFGDTSLWIFAAGRASLVWFKITVFYLPFHSFNENFRSCNISSVPQHCQT